MAGVSSVSVWESQLTVALVVSQVRGPAADPRQHPGSHQRQGQRHQGGSGRGRPTLLRRQGFRQNPTRAGGQVLEVMRPQTVVAARCLMPWTVWFLSRLLLAGWFALKWERMTVAYVTQLEGSLTDLLSGGCFCCSFFVPASFTAKVPRKQFSLVSHAGGLWGSLLVESLHVFMQAKTLLVIRVNWPSFPPAFEVWGRVCMWAQ